MKNIVILLLVVIVGVAIWMWHSGHLKGMAGLKHTSPTTAAQHAVDDPAAGQHGTTGSAAH